MTGKIENEPATLYLHKSGNIVFAALYTFSNNESGPVTISRGTIEGKMVKFDGLQGSFSNDHFSGTGSWNHMIHFPFSFVVNKDSLLNDLDFISVTGDTTITSSAAGNINFFAAGIWPSHNMEPGKSFYLKELISEQFNQKTHQELNEILTKQKNIFYTPVKLKDGTHANIDEQEVLVVYENRNLLSIVNITHSYTSETKEKFTNTYTVADLVHKRTLNLIDMMGTEGVDKLPDLLKQSFKQHFASKYKGQSTPVIITEHGDIQPNDNFYVTSKGLCFNYRPGEICDPAFGQVELSIPFTLLTAYLTPAITSLMK